MVILGNFVVAIPLLQATASESFNKGVTVFYATIMAIATAFLGPGAFSLDARKFGHRKIVIPPSSNSEKS